MCGIVVLCKCHKKTTHDYLEQLYDSVVSRKSSRKKKNRMISNFCKAYCVAHMVNALSILNATFYLVFDILKTRISAHINGC